MTIYLHRCLILQADQQSFAQGLCEMLAGPAGAGMFTTGVSPAGDAPATHFISAGMVEDTFAGIMSSPDVLFAVCQQAGLDIPLSKCKGLLDTSDISEDQPFNALDRIGLKLVQETL